MKLPKQTYIALVIYLIFLILLLIHYENMHHTQQDKPTPIIEPIPIQVSVEPIKEPEQPKFKREDIELIARVLYAEARGECDEGQQAIVQVIMNRVYSPLWGNIIQDVIRHEGQFVIGNTYTEKELKNVTYTLEHGYDMPADVMYFRKAKNDSSTWKRIGNHIFCTKG